MKKDELITELINENFEIINYQLKAKSEHIEAIINYYYNSSYNFSSSLNDFKEALIFDLFTILNNKQLNELENFRNNTDLLKYIVTLIKTRHLEYKSVNDEFKVYTNNNNNKKVYMYLDKTNINEALIVSHIDDSQVDIKNFKSWLDTNKETILTAKQLNVLEIITQCIDFDTFRVDFKKYKSLSGDESNHVIRDFNRIKKKLLKKFIETNTKIYDTAEIKHIINYFSQYLKLMDNIDYDIPAILDFIAIDFKNDLDLQDYLQSVELENKALVKKCIKLAKHNVNTLTVDDLFEIKMYVVDFIDELNKKMNRLESKNNKYLEEQKNIEFKKIKAKKLFKGNESGGLKVII